MVRSALNLYVRLVKLSPECDPEILKKLSNFCFVNLVKGAVSPFAADIKFCRTGIMNNIASMSYL